LILPRTLKLEVKAPRSGEYHLSARDIAGITPDGFLVALISERSLAGPRWTVVPANHLSIGTATGRSLLESEVKGSLSDVLNRGWSDWVLDRAAWGKLLEEGASGVRSRIAWCREHHPPRASAATGRLRETRVADALDALRLVIDRLVTADSGAQQEGSIHQVLLEDVLQLNGYLIVENPVGVPDIRAELRSSRVDGSSQSL
jgi:hypothetical protein